MKVHGDYHKIISRIADAGKERAGSCARTDAQPGEDRQELSRLTAWLQQELKRAEAEPSAQRAERMRRLEAEIGRGEYRVDIDALAAAMLDR